MAVVLVADDEPAIRSLATLILKSSGHTVVAAANGLEAIALYRGSPDQFDLVITDLDMPVMDGYQLIELIRQTRPDARIICMSGNPGRELPAGVLFLQKPFTPKQLCESADQTLGSKAC